MNNKALIIVKNAYSSIVEWSPKPLKKPTVDDDFHNLSAISRASESIKYNVMCLEYFLSPKGGLREFMKTSLSLCILFFFLWLPCIAAVTFFLHIVVGIKKITFNVFQTIGYSFLSLLLSVVMYAFIINLKKILTRIKPSND